MKDIVAQAEALSERQGARVDTGFLMLALVLGESPAGRLLRSVGLTESKVRGRLRENDVEPETLWKSVVLEAKEIEHPIRVARPTSLHLLVSALRAPASRAVSMLNALGVDPAELRTRALSCLTNAGEQRRTARASRSISLRENSQALPLPGVLTQLSGYVKPETVATCREPRPAAWEQQAAIGAPEELRERPRIPTRAYLGGGAEIEQKQRLQRSNRTSPAERAVIDTRRAKSPVREIRPLKLSREQFPLLSSLGRNLVEEALQGRVDEIVGREPEMEKITDVLNKRRANCPCIIGPSGVGKTALVEGLALQLSRSGVPGLEERLIIEVRPSDILAGTSVRGALAERIDQLRREVASADGQVILFLDEIHALLCSNDGQEALQELKSAIGRGELPCIAATTDDEYMKHVASDPALARRFTPVELAEPGEEEAIEIIKGIAAAYEAHHQVLFEEEAIVAAVKLSARYLPERALPDKAISLLDTAGARVRRTGADSVGRADIAAVLAEQIGVSADQLSTSNHNRLLHLEDELAKRIVGHRHVLAAIGETLRRNAAGFRSGRPIGSFLFLGPTGVGKTETAKALGDLLFPGEHSLVRIDMSEFREAHAVARLVGAPPGYVGHEEGGQLTESVRRRPYSLVLLDEIEKAHPDVLQLLLQVLDDGRLTDGLGRTVSFENTLVIMTSNLGANLRTEQRTVGFGAARSTAELGSISDRVLQAVKATLPPELWNRMDELLVFEPIGRDGALRIAELMIRRISEQLTRESNIVLEIGDGMLETLADLGGFDPEYGARPMRRTIQRHVEGPVARMILEGAVSMDDKVVGRGDGQAVTFDRIQTSVAAGVAQP